MPHLPSGRPLPAAGSARVLWVADEPLDPELGGGSIRQFHLFKALATALPTDLLIVGPPPDQRIEELAHSVSVLPRPDTLSSDNALGRRALALAVTLGSSYPSAMYPQRAVRQKLSRAIAERRGQYSVICVEHEGLSPVVSARGAERWLVTFHYLLSGMIERELDLAPGRRQRWFRGRDLDKALEVERAALRAYDRCVVCSAEDASTLTAVGGDARRSEIEVIPNGVDLNATTATPVPDHPRVLFPGRLDWAPNIDGALWFCAEVWPHVRSEVAEAELMLVGRSPADEVKALQQLPGVSVHPDVPSMAPYLESARVVLVPLRIGTGTRLKALEGLAAARPVLGTSTGLAGLELVDGEHVLMADHSERFARAVVRVLRDDELAGRLGSAGRAHVEARFGWDRIGERLVRLVSELLLAPPEADLIGGRSQWT